MDRQKANANIDTYVSWDPKICTETTLKRRRGSRATITEGYLVDGRWEHQTLGTEGTEQMDPMHFMSILIVSLNLYKSNFHHMATIDEKRRHIVETLVCDLGGLYGAYLALNDDGNNDL